MIKMIKAATSFILLVGYALALENFTNSQDTNFTKRYENEIRLKNDLFQNYSVDVLPPHNSTHPISISIQMSFIRIKDLDAKTQTSTTDIWFKLVWEDSRLTWNSKNYAEIGVIRTEGRRIWQPDLYLYNSANMNEMSNLMKNVHKLIYADGTVVWIPPATAKALCEIDLKYYPFDIHTCTWKIGSWTHAGDHLDLTLYYNETSVNLSDAITDGGEWEVVSTNAITSATKRDCCNETYRDVIFSMTFRRRSPFYTASIGSPLIAATFLILISFWISPTIFHRIMLNLVSMFTTITLLMHLTSSLPAAGKHTPLLMIVCGILLIISVLATGICVVFKTIASSKTTYQLPEWINKVVQNRLISVLLIKAPKHVSNSSNRGDSANLVTGDGQALRSATIPNNAGWMAVFQVIDRLFFLVCTVIIIWVIVTTVHMNQ